MRFLCIVFILIFVSCKEKKVRLQEDFVFGYAGMQNLKVFKFTGDTVFVSPSFPARVKAYFYLIDDYEKNKIHEYLDTIKGNSFEKEYINDDVVDGFEYQFEFLKSKKRVYVQNFESEATKALTEFADYLIHIDRYKKEIEHYNLKIDFGNVDIFYPPEPNPFE
ncbi:hypothetical protein SAMN05421741_10170 [Paenimyroides ummariense]|uniref:Lipoprotein n=1 Tax=Paenimyroides ummariense TaxID=913024 RepID=A0A1I4W4Z5_9FLAO|nr:hypothetical protein [Paenimyroides ummariense]SFN08585.1 hypothetical protein SAMN05421741_10170 [Paenimyroides ummariense]